MTDKIVIYARVSSAEQLKGYSVDAQIEICRKWAIENKFNVIRVYIEPGKSAQSDKRPKFQRMIKNLKEGEASGVLVYKTNRFARDVFDAIYYQALLNRHNVKLYSVNDQLLNSDSAKDILLSRITMVIDEYEAKNIGEEAKKGQLQKAESGHWPGGLVPLGYKRIGEKNQAQIVIDPEYSKIIIDAFMSFSTKRFTILTWTKEAKDRGYMGRNGNPIAKSSWMKYFRDVFYIGKMYWKGKIYEGKHKPLITKKLFNQVQSALDNNSGGKQKTHFWLLRGLLWSEPHARAMHGSISKEISYYLAKGRGNDKTQHSILANEAENQVMILLGKIRAVKTVWLAPDDWLLAFKVADNVGSVFNALKTNKDKRKLLKLVFVSHGLHVDKSGRITAKYIQPAFELFKS